MSKDAKYHNIKTRGYDSKKEAERARVLHLLEKAGKIHDLREQVRFELVPSTWETDACPFVPDWYIDRQKHGDIRKAILDMEYPTVPSCALIPTCAERQSRKALRAQKARSAERNVEYRADFVYFDEQDRLVVEDTKGVRTKDYIIKRKLMLWLYGIRIREV